jgi:hypothetical protein
MNFLGLFTPSKISSNEDILNSCLRLLLNTYFGPNKDFQGRLLKKYPYLTESQIQDYEQLCRQVEKFGLDIIYDTMVKRLKAFDPMTKQELKEFYKQQMKTHFSWVSDKNLKSIYNLASHILVHDGWYTFK